MYQRAQGALCGRMRLQKRSCHNAARQENQLSRGLRWPRLHENLVHKTPEPVFTAFKRLHQRMAGGFKMFARMLMRRRIATANVSTG